MKIVIASGYFNPLHTGHLSYLQEARLLGDELIVIVNNDRQVNIKGRKLFMNEKDREMLILNLKCVTNTWLSLSNDESISYDLYELRKFYSNDELIFAKGGDRNIDNIPQSERDTCLKYNIKVVSNVGCEKLTSSSEILKRVQE